MSWIRIGDYDYDVTNFIQKHPGGSVIKYLINQDATENFNEMHFRSKIAKKYLNTLPKRPTEIGETEVSDEIKKFRKLRQKLIDEGYFDPSYVHILYRVLELVSFFILGSYLTYKGYLILSVLTFGLFGARCGWLQHEGNHLSLTGIPQIDRIFGKFFIGFGLCTSADMWSSMHNKHHSTPQKINHDMDLDTMPLVGFFNTAVEKSYTMKGRKYSKLWMRFQAYTFVPITSGIFVMLFWMYFLHPRKIIRGKNYFEAFSVLLAHTIRPLIFHLLGGYSLSHSYLLFLCCQMISGMYLFGHFSLSHTFTPVIEENDSKNWVRYSFDHTVDISTDSWLVSWIMGYLNYQVVHHLFPQMPQFRHPEVSKMLAEYAKENGIKYQVVSYYDAWYLMFKNLDDVGKHYYNLDDKKSKTN